MFLDLQEMLEVVAITEALPTVVHHRFDTLVNTALSSVFGLSIDVSMKHEEATGSDWFLTMAFGGVSHKQGPAWSRAYVAWNI